MAAIYTPSLLVEEMQRPGWIAPIEDDLVTRLLAGYSDDGFYFLCLFQSKFDCDVHPAFFREQIMLMVDLSGEEMTSVIHQLWRRRLHKMSLDQFSSGLKEILVK